MKKILSLILAIVLVFSLAACGEDDVCEKHIDADGNATCDTCGVEFTCNHADADANNVCDECGAPYSAAPQAPDRDSVAGAIAMALKCIENSAPTAVITDVTRVVGNAAFTLNSHYELRTGTYAGKNATVYTEVEEKLRSVEDGSDTTVESPFETKEYRKEYLQGKGLRETDENGVMGKWKSTGLNFAPAAGSIVLNLSEESITKATYAYATYNNTLSFTVPYDNLEDVFGVNIDGDVYVDADSDVSVTIVNNGAQIISIAISYNIKADAPVPPQTVTMVTTYDYGIHIVEIAE